MGARQGFGGPRFLGPRGFAPHLGRSRFVGSPYRFGRPFYHFRPHFSLGFGLFVGYPVAYPYWDYPYGYSYPYSYPYPYGYSYPYPYGYPPAYPYPSGYPYPAYGSADPAYGYPPYGSASYPAGGSGSVDVQPARDSGGVSFDITPNTAAVYVDNTYVGTVAEFSPTSMPLTLTPGRHHIELRAVGYQSMTFDAEIVAGQVIPYRGTMRP